MLSGKVINTHYYEIDDLTNQFEFPIQGLRIEENNCVKASDIHGIGLAKTAYSEGPLISDYVTHEKEFKYDRYGIHVGQDDMTNFLW